MIGKLRNAYYIHKAKKSFVHSSLITKDIVFLKGAFCKNNEDESNVVIEKHCTIGAGFMCQCGGKIHVNENTYIGQGTFLQAKENIQIGKNVIISNNVIVCDNNNHPTDPGMRVRMSLCEDFMHDELWTWKYSESAPIEIQENVWIGRDVRILKGVTIGKGSIVAMGSIVTHDVPPYCIVAGNPARIVKRLLKEDEHEKN